MSIKNESDESPMDVLLIVGVPINEPVARCRPFVMNERHKIEQAIEDTEVAGWARSTFGYKSKELVNPVIR
jgi:redox-sensitive bicupin YhaK (pirin superfamily)